MPFPLDCTECNKSCKLIVFLFSILIYRIIVCEMYLITTIVFSLVILAKVLKLFVKDLYIGEGY